MKRLASVAVLVTAIVVGPAVAAAQGIGPAGGVTTLSGGVVLVVAPLPNASSPGRPTEAGRPPVPRLQPVSSAILREALKATGVLATPSGEPFTLTLQSPLVAGRGVLSVSRARFIADRNTILMDDDFSTVNVYTSDGPAAKHYMLQFTVADSSLMHQPFLVRGMGAAGGPMEVRATPGKVQEILVFVTLTDSQLTLKNQWLATIQRKWAKWCFFGVQITPM